MEEKCRSEIDTSAPFESVKEATTRFGGFGLWRPIRSPDSPLHGFEESNIRNVEEQALQLEKELIEKERDTLNVLKELENTKSFVEELKFKLQNTTSEFSSDSNINSGNTIINPSLEEEEKENIENYTLKLSPPSSVPGYILLELKQAKLNLTRTTNDLSEIRATVESFNKKIEKERLSLEKTRERLSFSSSKISSLEEELNQTRLKLQNARDYGTKGDFDDHAVVSRELRRLSAEAEGYIKMGEVAKREVLKAISDIEQKKTRIKTADLRLIAAKKMKEAARATEAVALAEMKALSSSESSEVLTEGVTLTFEEYTSLTSKARDAEEASRSKITDAMVLVDEANVSKEEILKRVEEASEEVKTSKRVLEEALSKVQAANEAKLSVEEALRHWRSENGQKRRSVQNTTKFKNTSYANHNQKEALVIDVDITNTEDNNLEPVLRSTLSIGQILSRKLLLTEDFENGRKLGKSASRQNKSLAQMLSSKPDNGNYEIGSERRKLSGKRKKFGFAKFSALIRKQNKSKKLKHNPYSGCGGTV